MFCAKSWMCSISSKVLSDLKNNKNLSNSWGIVHSFNDGQNHNKNVRHNRSPLITSSNRDTYLVSCYIAKSPARMHRGRWLNVNICKGRNNTRLTDSSGRLRHYSTTKTKLKKIKNDIYHLRGQHEMHLWGFRNNFTKQDALVTVSYMLQPKKIFNTSMNTSSKAIYTFT